MKTRWWWVRHGPTHAKNIVGWRDLPADLSDTAQITRLSKHLPKDAVVISSDLIRAVDTATALQSDRIRLPHEPQLREFHFGAWDGMHWSKISDRESELSRQFWEDPGDHMAPEGESWNQLSNRVSRVVDHLNGQHKDIIVVAHFGVILTQIARAAPMTPYQALGHEIDNFSVTRMDFEDDWHLRKINHLVYF